MNAHAELAVKALEQMRGDDLERFERAYGRPDDTATIAKQLWWDLPLQHGAPGSTPRTEHERLRSARQAVEWAIGWVKSKS